MSLDEVPTTKPNGARVLIVDDDADNRELLALILGWEGFSVTTAECGNDALACIARQLPDVLLLDVMMPGMNGYEVVAVVKAEASSRNVPVMLISALDDRETRARAAKAGGDDFLAKPFKREELIARVRCLLRSKPGLDVTALDGAGIEPV